MLSARGFRKREELPGFVRGAAVLSLGTVAAQLIPVAASPLLTRLYSSGAFGECALFTSALGILGAVACLKYDMAVVVAAREQEAVALFYLCLLIASGFAAAMLLLLPWAGVISALLGAGSSRWLYLLPLGTVLLGANFALQSLVLRTGQTAAISGAVILRSAVAAMVQLAAAPLDPGGLGLAASYLAAYAASALLMLSFVLPMLRCHPPDGNETMAAAARYSSYPGYTAAGALANSMVYNAGSFLLSSLYSAAHLGCYYLMNRMLAVPLTVFSGAVGQIFLQRLSRESRLRRRRLFLSVSGVMSLAALPMGIVVWLAAPLVPMVFGAGWEPAASMLRAMLPLFVIRFVVSPVSSAAIVAGRARATTVWQFSLLAVSWIPALPARLLGWEIERYLWWFGAVLGGCYLVFYLYCLLALRGDGSGGK